MYVQEVEVVFLYNSFSSGTYELLSYCSSNSLNFASLEDLSLGFLQDREACGG